MIYKGTSKFYANFRPRYPSVFFQLLIEKYSLDGTGEFLDLGAGPGTLSFPLVKSFKKIVAVEPESEMIQVGKNIQLENSIKNISWVCKKAENFDFGDRLFRLIGAGNAFHWMDRELTIKRAYEKCELGGGFFIVQRKSFWEGQEKWRQAIISLIKMYVGPSRNTVSGLFDRPLDGHFELIRRSDLFSRIEQVEIKTTQKWNKENLIGFLSIGQTYREKFMQKLQEWGA